MLVRFRKDGSGATAIEYSLVVALIAVAMTLSVNMVGCQLSRTFNDIADELADAN